jgi:hypothetical protein
MVLKKSLQDNPQLKNNPFLQAIKNMQVGTLKF